MITKSVQQITENDRATMTKLHNIAYYIMLHGLPFTQFKHLVKVEKLHNVTFTGAYENETVSKFHHQHSRMLFSARCQKENRSGEFIAILCDRSTDKSINEQEVIYVIYVDPDTGLPVMNFFEIAAPRK